MQVSVLVGTGTFSGLIAKPDSAAADRVPLPLKSSESDDAMSGSSSKRSPSDTLGLGSPAPTSALGLGSLQPRLRQDSAQARHTRTVTGLPPATSRLPTTAKSAGRKELDEQDVATVADASEAWRKRLKVSACDRIIPRRCGALNSPAGSCPVTRHCLH